MLYDEAVEATSELLCLHWLLLYATSVEHTGCHCLIDAAASKIADCFEICLIVVGRGEINLYLNLFISTVSA